MTNTDAKLETLKRAESVIRATYDNEDLADNLYALECELGRDTTYNGWTNYPTWAINLWLSSDEGLYRATLELVTNAVAGSYIIDDSNVRAEPLPHRLAVADALEDWVRNDLAPDLGPTSAADLLGYALSQVDWNKIADAWLEDAAETVNA